MKKQNKRSLVTQQELADRAGVSLPTVRKWMVKSTFPKRGANGWDALKFDEFAKVALQQAVAQQTGHDSDLKRTKLQKQIELLDVQISAAKRADLIDQEQYMILDEHTAELVELSQHFKQSILQWPGSMAAKHNLDAALYVTLKNQAQTLIESIGHKLNFQKVDADIQLAAEQLAKLAHSKWEARNGSSK
jgi:hypothetical protein